MEEKNVKQLTFIVVLALVALAIYLLYSYHQYLGNYVGIAALALLVFVIFRYNVIVKIDEYERGVVLRLGRVVKVIGPGLHFLIPFVDHLDLKDIRSKTVDIKPQDVVTRDNIELKVDSVIYLHIGAEPQQVVNAVTKVDDYKQAARLFVQSTIRDVVGTMTLSEVISSIDLLNKKLKIGLKKLTSDWGIVIDSVEIKDVDIPKSILKSMHEQKSAEQKKMARKEIAEAEKIEIEAVREATKTLSPNALSYYYIKALEKMSDGKATKMVFPIEITRLAESVSGKLSNQPKDVPDELILKYQDIIKKMIDQSIEEKLAQKS